MNGIGIDFGTTGCRPAILENEEFRQVPEGLFVQAGPMHLVIDPDCALPAIPGYPEAKPVHLWLRQESAKSNLGTLKGTHDSKGARKSPWQAEVTASLEKLRDRLEEFLDTDVEGAFLATPVMYGMNQTAALRAAGEAAGLGQVSLMHDPYAAVLHEYKQHRGTGRILVFCLGRSAFSASVISLENGKPVEVAHEGSLLLGGQDFEGLMLQELIREMPRQSRHDLTYDRKAMAALVRRAEEAKLHLDSSAEVTIRIGPYKDMLGQTFETERRVTSGEFQEWTAPLVAHTVALSKKAIVAAGLQLKDIDEILMVGEATRSPHLLREIDRTLGRPRKHAAPEAVARGAALYAASQRSCFTPGKGRTRTERKEAASDPSSEASYTVILSDEPTTTATPPRQQEKADELEVAWRKAIQAQSQEDLTARITALEELVAQVHVRLSHLHCMLAARMRDAGDLEGAWKELEKADKYYPENQQTKRVRAGLHIEMAKACVRGNPRQARSHLQKSLKLDPGNIKAQSFLAQLEEDLGLKRTASSQQGRLRRSKSHGKKKGRR